MTDAPELLPCPFCGGEAEVWRASDRLNLPAWVACMGRCAVLISKEHKTTAEAVAAWNTRADLHEAQLAALRDRVEALEEALRPFAEAASILDVQSEEGGAFFWGGKEQRQAITTWMGPTDFGKARAALKADQ